METHVNTHTIVHTIFVIILYEINQTLNGSPLTVNADESIQSIMHIIRQRPIDYIAGVGANVKESWYVNRVVKICSQLD